MKAFKKKLLKSLAVQSCLGFLIHSYIRFVFATSRWDRRYHPQVRELVKDRKPLLCVFWHGRLAMLPCLIPQNLDIKVVISSHGDGAFISRVIGFFGIGTVSGSSRKGGVNALKGALGHLKEHGVVAITPDGPRGPRMHWGGNAVKIAMQANVPIVPVSWSIKRHKILKSWDAFMFPLPFTKGIYLEDEPFFMAQNASQEDIKIAGQMLEKRLNTLTRQADEAVGRPPVMPA